MRGYVLITMVSAMVVILGLAGLDIDVAYLQYTKMRMQTAADAAAVAGVQEFKLSGPANITGAAKAVAARNGFTDGQQAVTITVNHPPLTGYYSGNGMAVEVLISRTVPTFFMVLVGSPSATVRARAVSRPGPASGCVYSLDPAVSGALSASGTVAIHLGCGALVNSSSASAITATGGAVISGAAFSVHGNYSLSGGGSISPLPLTGTTLRPDPLAYLAPPPYTGCTQSNYHLSGGKTDTLCAGVYDKGITIDGGSTAHLSPGNYILNGGGLTVTGGSSLVGTGVTFYSTAGASNYAGISIAGGTTIKLSAPTSGPLAGILFFQDRTIVGGGDSSFSGGATTVLNGALYFPTTSVSYSGGSASSGTYTILVGKTVSFTGNTTVNNDYTSLANGSPIRGDSVLGE